MSEENNNKKWWASALQIGGVVAFVALPIGALGTKFGVWEFTLGFMLLAVGVVLATAVFFLGLIAVIVSHIRQMTAGRNSSAIGLGFGILVLGIVLGPAMSAFSVPPIHNITTDTENPPAFNKIAALRDELKTPNPHAYDAKYAEQQKPAYPQLKSLISSSNVADMMGKVTAAIETMGMEVVAVDAAAGVVEATDETFWFGFKDDVVVRVKPEGTGSIVDVRSVSRVGQSDLGKNAQRIGELLSHLKD